MKLGQFLLEISLYTVWWCRQLGWELNFCKYEPFEVGLGKIFPCQGGWCENWVVKTADYFPLVWEPGVRGLVTCQGYCDGIVCLYLWCVSVSVSQWRALDHGVSSHLTPYTHAPHWSPAVSLHIWNLHLDIRCSLFTISELQLSSRTGPWSVVSTQHMVSGKYCQSLVIVASFASRMIYVGSSTVWVFSTCHERVY